MRRTKTGAKQEEELISWLREVEQVVDALEEQTRALEVTVPLRRPSQWPRRRPTIH